MTLLKTRLGVTFRASPHHRSRKGAPVELIVIHSISCPPGRFGTGDIEKLFLGRLDCSNHPAYGEVAGLELSSHFLIDRKGVVTQFVDTGRAAYHAGRSNWKGRGGCNDYAVGIELEGDDERDFTKKQYGKLVRLCRDVMATHGDITPDRIVGHCHIAPGRKTDPGPRFDWILFHRQLRAALRD